MTIRAFVLGTFAVLLGLALVSAALVVASEQVYADGVPARIAPASIQHDEALLAQAQTLQKTEAAPHFPNQIFNGTVTEAELTATIQRFASPLVPYAALDSHLNETFNGLVLAQSAPDPKTAADDALSSAAICLLGDCGWDLAITLTEFAGAAVACGVVTAVTLGIGVVCFIALIVVAVSVMYLGWLLSQTTAAEGTTYDMASSDIQDFNNATSALAATAYDSILLVATSLGTLSAQAEAAALAQLGGEWSQANDTLNSTLGGAMAGLELSIFSAVNAPVFDIYNQFADDFTGNPGCSLLIENGPEGQFFEPYGTGTEGTLCGSPVTHSNEVNGVAPYLQPIQTWGVGTCSGVPNAQTSTGAFYIGSGVRETNSLLPNVTLSYALWGSGTIKVYGLNSTYLGSTIAASTYGSWANWTFGSGGFLLCSTDGATIGLEASFPLNDATEAAVVSGSTQQNPEQIAFFGPNPDDTGSQPESVTPFSTVEIIGYGDLGTCLGSIYGNGSGIDFGGDTCRPSVSGPAAVLENLTYLLFSAVKTADTYGEAYWAFLTYLGFGSISELPESCLIPTPSDLVPPTIGLVAMEDMTVFQLLVAFTSELKALNETFNNSAFMPTGYTFSICGLTAPIIVCGTSVSDALNQTLAQYLTEANIWPVDPSWWACSFGLSTEGVGYVYDGTGTVGNNLTDARTWTFGFDAGLVSMGILTISGALGGVGPIPINQTWELPNAVVNPTTVTVQDLTNKTNTAADPASCVANLTSTLGTGCEPESLIGVIPDNPAAGNSTLAQGSALGQHESGTPGTAVYLVGCLTVTGGNIFNVTSTTQTSGTCEFTSVNWSWGETWCEQHPDSPICQTGCQPSASNNYCCLTNCGGYNFCLEFPIVSTFTNLLGNWLGSIGIGSVNLGGVGQAIGCIIGVIVLAVAVVGALYAVFWVIRRSR